MITKKEKNHFTFDGFDEDFNILYECDEKDKNDILNDIINNICFISNGGHEFWVLKQLKEGKIIYSVNKNIPKILGDMEVENDRKKITTLKMFIKKNIRKIIIKNFGFYPHSPLKTINFKESTLNCFNGFANEYIKNFEINENIIKPILNHIKILANHEDNSYNYILNYLARIIQVPENKSGVCMVFMGNQGSGKTSFFEWYNKNIIGEEWTLTISNNENIFRNFNSELSNKLVTILDEAQLDGSYKKKADQLKSLITQNYIRIENKGLDPIVMNDRNNYIILTNNDFPVKVEQSDRRFAAFQMSNDVCGNTDYFKELNKAFNDKEIKKHFFHYLLYRDIIDFHPERDIPLTEAKQELKKDSSPSPVRFAIDVIKNGIKDPKNKDIKNFDDIATFMNDKNQPILDTENLYKSYKDFMIDKCPGERILVENGFINQINKLLNIKTKKNKGKRNTIINEDILKKSLCNYFKVDDIKEINLYEFKYERNDNEINKINVNNIESEENNENIKQYTKDNKLCKYENCNRNKHTLNGIQLDNCINHFTVEF